MVSGVRHLLDDRFNRNELSTGLRGQQNARDTRQWNSPSTRDPSPRGVIDEQEPRIELLGEGNRFRLTGIQKPRKFPDHLLIGDGLDREPLRVQSVGKHRGPRPAGPDCKFVPHRGRNGDPLMNVSQKIEAADAGQ